MPKLVIKLFLIIISTVFITSCNNEDINKITSIKVEPNNSQILLGTNFIFNVETDTSLDVTNESVIFIDGIALVDNEFVPDQLGTYTVTANYEEYTSQSVQIEVVEESIYSHKLLIEDYTGTWCGFCPRIAHSIELLKEDSDKIVSVAVHLYDANDIYSFDGSTSLNATFAIGGLPEGRLNRIHKWTYPENTNLEQALDLIDLGAPLGLAINSSVNGNQIEAEIKVGFSQSLTTSLGLVVYLTENGLIHDQENYTNFYPVGQYVNPLEDFVHNEVLRAVYTDELGDVIPLTESVEDNIYSVNMSKSIPASVEDNSKLHLVAFVVNKDTNEVINVQEALVGEDKDFD